MFLDNANKLSDVTLAFVDVFQFSAHKGSKIRNQYKVIKLIELVKTNWG